MSTAEAAFEWVTEESVVHDVESFQAGDGDLVVAEIHSIGGWLKSGDTVAVKR